MVSDLGEQIVNNVYQTLIDYGYEQHEIDSIITRDSIELDINNNECVLYCGNDIIFKAPGNILIHKFVTEAEDHLLQWCINKIGRKPNYLDANELFGDVPGWNNLNEAYGTDFEDTLAWVQKKFPNKSEKEQHQFAKNIMKRYVAPVETDSTDIIKKPQTRKNAKLIKIVDIPNHGKHQDVYCKSLLLRTARKPGDTERVNHTVLGRLNAAGVKYEIIDENVNKNMTKKNTIRLTESELKQIISETVKKILKENDGYSPEATEYFINDINTCRCKMTDVFNIGEEDDMFAIITDIEFSNGNQYHVYIDCDFDGNIVDISGCFYGENYPDEEGLEFKPLDRANLQKLTSLLQNDIWDCMDNYYDE